MEDTDLQAIRQQRMSEMQSQFGGNSGGQSENDNQKASQERMQQQEDMKNSILTQILDQNARARLNTLKISKPEKAQMVEGMIIRMAQSGQLGGKIDDNHLVQLLESLNSQMPRSESSVKFDRRRAAMDDDDEDYLL